MKLHWARSSTILSGNIRASVGCEDVIFLEKTSAWMRRVVTTGRGSIKRYGGGSSGNEEEEKDDKQKAVGRKSLTFGCRLEREIRTEASILN